MIRAQAGPLLVLGVDAENVRRLKAGKPIVVDLTDYLGTERVIIMYGETLADIARELEEATGAPLPPAQPDGHQQRPTMTGSRTTAKACCPKCHATLDGGWLSDAVPNLGDLSVCIYCAALLQFNMDLTLAEVAPAELAALPDGERESLLAAQRVIRQFLDDYHRMASFIDSLRRPVN